MSTRRNRRRLLLILVPLVAVAVVVGLRVLPDHDGGDTGLTVHAEVLDSAGKPVDRASVQCRFRPGWVRVDSRGRATLEDVVLRANDDESPAAIEAALEVGAPYHALPHGAGFLVERREDGAWHARWNLRPVGMLRVAIKETNLPEPSATVQAVGRHGLIEAIDGVQVARLDQPARYRVFEGVELIRIRQTGAAGTVTRVTEMKAPAPGSDREIVVVAQEAVPIRGRIVASGDLRPPLFGEIHVFQSGATEAIELPRLKVLPGDGDRILGTFEVSYAGRVRYRIVPHLAGIEAEPIIAEGGEEIAIEARATAPWLAVRGFTWRTERTTVRYRRLPDGEPRGPGPSLLTNDGALVFFLPEIGRYAIDVYAQGNPTQPPRRGSAEIEVGVVGAHAAELAVVDHPWGTVAVEVEDPAAKGASVQVLGGERRTGTLLPGLGTVVSIRHVPADDVRLKVMWQDEQAAVGFLVGTVAADGTLRIQAPHHRGGTLELAAAASAPQQAVERMTLAWKAGDTPYGDAPGEIPLGQGAADKLRPGSYRAYLQPQEIDEVVPPIEVTFEIRAGETTTLTVPTR